MAEKYDCECGVSVTGEGEYNDKTGMITVSRAIGGAIIAVFSLWVLVSVSQV